MTSVQNNKIDLASVKDPTLDTKPNKFYALISTAKTTGDLTFSN